MNAISPVALKTTVLAPFSITSLMERLVVADARIRDVDDAAVTCEASQAEQDTLHRESEALAGLIIVSKPTTPVDALALIMVALGQFGLVEASTYPRLKRKEMIEKARHAIIRGVELLAAERNLTLQAIGAHYCLADAEYGA